MTLTPMAPSAWRYYAEEIATGREDYYALAAERPGRFVGRGAAALGIDGTEVSAEALERLFGHGSDPRNGAPLGRGFSPDNPRAVAGFALTFSPPKTVSVLWALGEQVTSDAVAAAHDAAVTAALRFVDDHASFTRRGHNGVLQVDTDGLVTASFVHRTSRAADPQLHTHVLVANKVRAADGKWLSIDARELFETQKAAGMLYKAALRSELSARAGVRWTAVDDNGIAEIKGVPPLLVEYWSVRRHELKAMGDELIASRSAELGRSLSANERAECFQIAAYRTRIRKIDADTPTAELRARWAEEARSWNLGPERWLDSVIDREEEPLALRLDTFVSAVVARLEDRAATWGRAHVVQEASRLVSGSDAEMTRQRVEALADLVLRDRAVVSLAGPLPAEPPSSLRRRDGMSAVERHGAVRFTTTATLRREAAILDAAADGTTAGVAVLPGRFVNAVLERSALGPDQREAVRGLLVGGEQVALLVGPAGTGKSRALDAARGAWEAANYEPIGLAPSAMAASVLATEAGLRADTLARFLLDVEQARVRLSPRNVVVVDEAGMARTDDLAKLVGAVREANAKLVLVGDPAQLGAVGSGGIFRTLVADRGAHELETVRRFNHAWEAAASLRLRIRDPNILAAYVVHDRIADGSREQMLDRAFAKWRAARQRNESIVVTANDNATVEELARRIRADRVRRGEVERKGVPINSGIASHNDEIVTLRNDRSLRPTPDEFVRNGALWRVVDANDDGSLTVVPTEGRGRVDLPPEYVREHVALAYVLTVHKAQGMTADRSVTLVDSRMTAAQLYVAMSRGREENIALVVSSDDAPEDHVRRPSLGALDVLANVMRRDGIDRSAHEVMREGLSHFENRDLLRDLHEDARQRREAEAGPDHSKEIAALAKVNVRDRRDFLAQAEQSLYWAGVRRQEAEQHEASVVANEPVRARLPGRLGADARAESEQRQREAHWYVNNARQREQKDLRRLETARHQLAEAERAANDLTFLREAQAKREQWIQDHPDDERWERELLARLVGRDGRSRRSTETAQSSRDRDERDAGPSRLPRATAEIERLELDDAKEAVAPKAKQPKLDPATEAVLDRVRRRPDPDYERAPEPLPRMPRGPVLER